MITVIKKFKLSSLFIVAKSLPRTDLINYWLFPIVDGGFTVWSNWDACTLTCGTGSQTRTRSCSNPVPEYCGQDCIGDVSEINDCNTDNCPSEFIHSRFARFSVGFHRVVTFITWSKFIVILLLICFNSVF